MKKWNDPEHKTGTAPVRQNTTEFWPPWNATATATESAVAHGSSDTTPATSCVTTTDAFEALMTKSDESHPTVVADKTPDALTIGEDPPQS